MANLPPAPRNAKALLVSPETYEELRRVANAELIPDTADFQVQTRNGKKTLRLREKPAPSASAVLTLPFAISVTATQLRAEPGVMGSEDIAETIENTPASGQWYLEAKIVIDPDDGLISASTVDWVSAPNTNTSTDYHSIIGEVTVTSGVPDATTIVQYTYGPLLVVKNGEVDSAWGVIIY